MGDGGRFGQWDTDSDGLPCFDIELSALSPDGMVLPAGDARRVWHQLGNDSLTATAHAGGWCTFYSTEAGLVRLNGSDPLRPSELGGTWVVRDPQGREMLSSLDPVSLLEVRWGAGYAEWRTRGAGFELKRRISITGDSLPAARIDVSIVAADGGPLPPCRYTERWGFKPYPLFPSPLMSRRIKAPGAYTPAGRLIWDLLFTGSSFCRWLTEGFRALLGAGMRLEATFDAGLDGVVLATRRGAAEKQPLRPSLLPRVPGVIFICPLSQAAGVEPVTIFAGASREGGINTVELDLTIGAGALSAGLSFALGIARRGALPGVKEAMNATVRTGTAEPSARSCSLELGSAPAIAHEATWHACFLKSATTRDGHFSCRFVPQGSAYGFVHGIQGAPRDYAFTCVPLTYIDPPTARDMLRLMMRLTRPDGSMSYAHAGSGATTSALVHGDPTDLPLFLLWALTEYVWATGETGFMEEVVPFLSRRNNRSGDSTVMERAILAWRHTRESVGTGEHGLLRAGSGDWSDPIVLMAPRSRDFHRRGESTFNSAMAVYVLPRAAEIVSAAYPVEATAMLDYAGRLREAVERAWCGKWYLRGWDGRGGPIGREHLFLDAQVWCLIAGIGSEDRRRSLVESIARACDEPSPIGATILDHPHPVRLGILAPGWDCNGGVWSAINGLLAWAYSLHDAGLAWRCLEKQSLSAHARAYPHVWYGIWSGPDSYNAHYAERPGETYVHPATPMSEFPVMNSNAHAGPLLALLKTLGVESGPSGVFIEHRLSGEAGPWRLSTTLVDAEGGAEGARITRGPAKP